MIAYAKEEMIPDLVEIWKEAFGDSEEYIHFFFSHNLIRTENGTIENQVVWLEENRPVSMFTILHAKIQFDRAGTMEKEFWYIYAVATKKNWRGNGIAGHMMDFICQKARDSDAIVGLVPATESLFQFYQKRSFQVGFYLRVVSMEFEKNVKQHDYMLTEVSAKQYVQARNEQLSGSLFINWNLNAVGYALLENRKMNGICSTVRYQNKEYILFGCVYENCLYVKETTVPEDILHEVVCEVSGLKNCHMAEVRLHPEHYQLGAVRKYGMFCGNVFSEEMSLGYLGLALD